MKRALQSQSGFSLVEMLLAMALFAMVMAGVYAALNVGLNARKQRQAETLQTARAALAAATRSLESAFAVPGSDAYGLIGDAARAEFTVFPQNARGPERVAWFLGDGKSCRGLCRTNNKDPFNPDAPEPEPEPVAPDVSAMEFSYFDGSAWQPAWRAPGALPLRVRMVVEVTVEDAAPERFETETSLPAASAATSAPPPE